MKKSPYEHGRQVFGPTAELNFKMGLSNFFVVQLWITGFSSAVAAMATVVVWMAASQQEIRRNRSAVQKDISISVMKNSPTN